MVNSNISVERRKGEVIPGVGGGTAQMVVIEKTPDISVKSSFFKADGQKGMIQRREKLCNIKCDDTSVALLEPLCLNEMHEVDASINSGPLSNASELIGIQETAGCKRTTLRSLR